MTALRRFTGKGCKRRQLGVWPRERDLGWSYEPRLPFSCCAVSGNSPAYGASISHLWQWNKTGLGQVLTKDFLISRALCMCGEPPQPYSSLLPNPILCPSQSTLTPKRVFLFLFSLLGIHGPASGCTSKHLTVVWFYHHHYFIRVDWEATGLQASPGTMAEAV